MRDSLQTCPDLPTSAGSLALARSAGWPLVAALFVQPRGCYAGLAQVDLWPESRDARQYAGPLPVVAHPPCHLWVNLAALNFKRYGGEHNRPGNDGGCFAAALAAVRKWGGVLEHPAGSNAWPAHDLTAPAGMGWQRSLFGGWVCEVWQSAYGHKARKRTWLYYAGTAEPFELRWNRTSGTHQCGWFDRIKPSLSKREASATPPEFRDALMRLAMEANERTPGVRHPANQRKHNMDSTENVARKPGCLDALVRAPGWILTEPSPGSFSLRTEGGENVASITFGSLDIGDRREAAETLAHWLREHWRNEMNRRKSQTCEHKWRPAQSGHRHFWTRERLMICPKCDARQYADDLPSDCPNSD